MSKDWIDNAYFMQKKARTKVPQYMSFGKNADMNKTMNSFKDTHHTMGQSGASVFGKNNTVRVDPKFGKQSRQNTFKAMGSDLGDGMSAKKMKT
jgi:hypothetical protein